MLVARFFDGFVGSAFLSVAAGTIADLFKPQDIELPMMIFTISPFWGPVLGPVLGGLINDFTNWYAVDLFPCRVSACSFFEGAVTDT